MRRLGYAAVFREFLRKYNELLDSNRMAVDAIQESRGGNSYDGGTEGM
jgi:hypothetical protein